MWVGAADYDAVSQFKWYARQDGKTDTIWYAMRRVKLDSGKPGIQYLHTFLTGWSLVDHEDGNGLNNRRGNLRPATRRQQVYNRPPFKGGASKYKGVSLDGNKWRAYIAAEGIPSHCIGRFKDELDAARAYDDAANKYHGDYAWLNCDHFDELEDYWHWQRRIS